MQSGGRRTFAPQDDARRKVDGGVKMIRAGRQVDDTWGITQGMNRGHDRSQIISRLEVAHVNDVGRCGDLTRVPGVLPGFNERALGRNNRRRLSEGGSKQDD